MRILIFLLLVALNDITAFGQKPQEMVRITGGKFVTLYGKDVAETTVEDFYLDTYPVSNQDYLAFVKENQTWSRSTIKKIYADEHYLNKWDGDTQISEKIKDSPVTNVSWFAAKAFCECQGKRLPLMDEWEYAGLASETNANASGDTEFYQRILDWYSKPNPAVFPSVKNSFKNFHGLYGMHGLVWEWVLDFNAVMLTTESRSNGSVDRQLFCAGGSQGVQDTRNYVAFMRYAFRSSLKGNYTVANLGFRCAKNTN